MPTTKIGAELFRAEAERRLVDTWALMMAFDLRSKQAVFSRVESGKLPKPVLVLPSNVSLWDADEVEDLTGVKVPPTDRRED